MTYKIVVDSCCELPEKHRGDSRFEIVPLGLEVGEYHTLDDETFDQADFLARVAACPQCPKSACPSPERYMQAYEGEAEHIWVVTLSSHLSGSYNSAVLGKMLYEETHEDARIHVIDSESASCGETQIVQKLIELEKQGFSFEEIVGRIEAFRSSVATYFVLDTLDTLRKNGRLVGLKAVAASTLNIKPIMAGEQGQIVQRGQSVGMKKALRRMAELILEETEQPEERILMISHCNAPERAAYLKKLLLAQAPFRGCVILETRGISSLYANDGGVIVAV